MANPLGLAAGFDKDGEGIARWRGMGFGFAEIGTVTALAQPGNPRPRLFRLPEDRALINRMGFNNHGAVAMRATLERRPISLPLGINLGKSKLTAVEDAAADYAESFSQLRGFGAYVVVNVSSPNTPGLRGLQERGPLTEILQRLREIDAAVPLLVKIAPDLERTQIDAVLEVAHAQGLAGLIATNTTLARDGLTLDPNQAGGLSGATLTTRADDVLKYVAAGVNPELVLIGSGGVMTGEDVYRKLQIGADLVQAYTGWVYGGPSWPGQVIQELLAAMDRDGVPDVTALARSRRHG